MCAHILVMGWVCLVDEEVGGEQHELQATEAMHKKSCIVRGFHQLLDPVLNIGFWCLRSYNVAVRSSSPASLWHGTIRQGCIFRGTCGFNFVSITVKHLCCCVVQVLFWDTTAGNKPVASIKSAHGMGPDVHCVDWSGLQEHLVVTGGCGSTGVELLMGLFAVL